SCVRILRREAKVLGRNTNFTIYDAQDAQRLVSQILKELGLDTKKYAPRAILHRISNLKNELQTPDDFSPPEQSRRRGARGRLQALPLPTAPGQCLRLRRPHLRDRPPLRRLPRGRRFLPAAVPAHPRR